jgi:hypothetical protein
MYCRVRIKEREAIYAREEVGLNKRGYGKQGERRGGFQQN